MKIDFIFMIEIIFHRFELFNFTKNIKMKILILLLLISVNVSCQEKNNQAQVGQLTSDSLNVLLKKNPGVLIDVRTPEEFAEGHIPGAINIDYNNENFEKGIDSLKKDIPYQVYCRSGKRSSYAADIMTKKGFKKIDNLEGGILGWEEKGYETVK